MTMLRIDPTADVPPYEQVRRQLVAQIETGQLPGDTRLPAVRRLASDLGIAPGTVARAYKELEGEGYLVARGRHGTRVASMPEVDHDEVRRLTSRYIAGMQRLGVDSQAIIGSVHRGLAE